MRVADEGKRSGRRRQDRVTVVQWHRGLAIRLGSPLANMIPILASGPGWVVIDKPSGLRVHRDAWSPREDAVVQHLRDQLGAWVYPVHRLDKGVSGCLLLGTEAEAVAELQAALTAGQKTYHALVRGHWNRPDEVRIEQPMKDEEGVLREAASVVRCLAVATEARASWVAVYPETGRYHQVRRHLRDLNHPILGDTGHGDARENRAWKERGLHRIALHCAKLSVAGLGEIVSPLPDALREIVAAAGVPDAVLSA